MCLCRGIKAHDKTATDTAVTMITMLSIMFIVYISFWVYLLVILYNEEGLFHYFLHQYSLRDYDQCYKYHISNDIEYI